MQVFSIGVVTMLEVVFGDSEKGSMKVAKNYNAKTMLGGAIGYIGKKPTKAELEKHFEGQAIGGNSQDVVNIGFLLDIGDISGEIDGMSDKLFSEKYGEYLILTIRSKNSFSKINARIWRSCCLLQKMVYQYEYGKATLLILPVDFTLYAIY
jgi:hypothetical protein